MSRMQSSVGRGGVNRPEDVRIVQALLNKCTQPPLRVDGVIGPKTIAAIEDFQQRVVHMRHPDGRVDPDGHTFTALSSSATDLPAIRGGAGLTEADFARAAAVLGCEVACIKAVAEVESSGSGFLASKRPKILFEAHIFSGRTQHQYDTSHADISSHDWNRALYKGGEQEYARLEQAMALNREAALASASWGRFQIMGFNAQSAGFSSVDAFVDAMFDSEGRHLDAFVNFLRHGHLDAPLRDKRWADFARGYNGQDYEVNRYDTRLKAAYEKYSR